MHQQLQDYTAQGGGRELGLCPKTPNCITTASELDEAHFVPPWNVRSFPHPSSRHATSLPLLFSRGTLIFMCGVV